MPLLMLSPKLMYCGARVGGKPQRCGAIHMYSNKATPGARAATRFICGLRRIEQTNMFIYTQGGVVMTSTDKWTWKRQLALRSSLWAVQACA